MSPDREAQQPQQLHVQALISVRGLVSEPWGLLSQGLGVRVVLTLWSGLPRVLSLACGA